MVPMNIDAYEMATPYMQSALGEDSLGIMFQPPQNPVKLREHTVHDECLYALLVRVLKKKKSRQMIQARVRTVVKPMQGRTRGRRREKGLGKILLHRLGVANEADSFNRNEMRFMKKTAELTYKKMKKRFLPKIKKWFDELKEMSCSHSRGFEDVDPRRPPRRPPHVDDDVFHSCVHVDATYIYAHFIGL